MPLPVVPQKKTIDINGFRIDTRINELEKEHQFAFEKMNNLIASKAVLSEVLKYAQILSLISNKVAKWKEVKALYELNVSMNVFDKQMSLYEVQQLATNLEFMVSNLESITGMTANSNDAAYDLPTVYVEFRKQKRILNHYKDSIQIAKTQVGTFELDISLLDD